jgi:hypothetical protein
MTTLVSKRHRTKFYLTVIFGFLVFIAMGTAMLFIAFKNDSTGELKPGEYVMAIFSAVIYFLAFYTVYKYFKNSPKIQLDHNSISFNNKRFLFADIIDIQLTGKQNFFFIMSFPMEAAALTFKDGKTRYIFDDLYENSSDIKSFLQQVVINKEEFVEQVKQDIDPSDLDTVFYEVYNGNQFTSLRGILLWGLIAFFIYIFFNSKKPPSTGVTIFIFLYCLFWFFFFSWMMNYFKVSKDFLVIKNQNLFWRTNAYRINEIEEIVYESRQKMPNCLRVITKDFKSRLYPAATLRDKTWLRMKDDLESMGVKVRNECI